MEKTTKNKISDKESKQIDMEVESLFDSGVVGDKTAYENAVTIYQKKNRGARYNPKYETVGLFAVANSVQYVPREDVKINYRLPSKFRLAKPTYPEPTSI